MKKLIELDAAITAVNDAGYADYTDAIRLLPTVTNVASATSADPLSSKDERASALGAEWMRQQAASVAAIFDAKSFRQKYEVTHARKRYDQYQAECFAANELNIQSEDTQEAIPAIPAPTDDDLDRAAQVRALIELVRRAQKIIDPCYPKRSLDWQEDALAALPVVDTQQKEE